MSHYLIERIEADPKINLVTGVEVQALAGEEHLEQVTLRHTATGEQQTIPCSGLFCFIGAQPATGWLGDGVLLDHDGFVLTDRQLPASLDRGHTRRRCRSRPRCPACSPPATSATAR